MRQRSFFAGLALVAIIASAAVSQSRIYRAGSSGTSGTAFNDNSSSRGGAMSSTMGGSGSVIAPRSPAAGAQSATAPAATATPNTSSNATRPTFIAIDGRERQIEREREFHRHHVRNSAVFYPYYVYPPSDTANYSDEPQPQPVEQVAEPEAPAPTIFENRPGYQVPPVRAYQPTDQPTAGPASNTYQMPEEGQRVSAVDPQPTTILVFRDGHQLEIGNYAIVGNTLYNMAGANETHKILLSDLDLDKTIKVNQARGYDFRLPKRTS